MAINPLTELVNAIDDIDNFKALFYEKVEQKRVITKDDIDRLLAEAAARPLLEAEKNKLRAEVYGPAVVIPK